MKESGKECLKSTIYESTLSTAPRSPFPDGEGLVVGIAAIRGKRISNIRGEPTQSRCARQPLPEEGARMWGVLSVSIPPSFGRRCPQGGGWVTQGGVKDDVRLSIFLGKYGSIAVRFYF